MKKKKIIRIIVIAAIAGALWLYHHKKLEDEALQKSGSDLSKGEAALKQQVLSFTIDGSSPKGAKQWHLEGNSAEIKGEEIHLAVLSGVAYGEDVTVNLTSDKGIYYKDKKEVELIGNVKVVSDDGVTLTTDRARWEQDAKKVYTDDPVRIERENMVATGEGGWAKPDEKTAVLKKDVVVSVKPDTMVKSDGPLEVYYSNNKAIFNDNVMVEDKDGRLFSDKLTIYFDPKTQALVQAVSEGNVKMKRGNTYTISEKAIYTESTKSAELMGRPRIVIDPEEVEKLDGMEMEKIDQGSEAKDNTKGSK